MGCLKDRVSGHIIDVRSGRNADTANNGSQGIGNIVAVQVQGGNNRVFSRAQQNLLQESIRNHILYNDLSCRYGILLGFICGFLTGCCFNFIVLRPGKGILSELPSGKIISPLLEGAFGKLHDIPFVNKG